jgi:DNA modification methylase
MKTKNLGLRSIHPFPARMAAEIAFENLKGQKKPLKILDPMVGSGTTMAVATRQGHKAQGFDTDPLAVLITKVWCSNENKKSMILLGEKILIQARNSIKHITLADAYPDTCKDNESKSFVRYWFDASNRKQLCALSREINKIENKDKREVLWCALSRMIIKKKGGVSLAMDTSHSRPHKVQEYADHRAFDLFQDSLKKLLETLEETGERKIKPVIRLGDARKLPIGSKSIDMIITSPPYLNAIDYLRGHRLSLIWMGYSIPSLRIIRSENIGSQGSRNNHQQSLERIVALMCDKKKIPSQLTGMLKTYLSDLQLMLKETFRVLKPSGSATFVIGNSSVQGVYVRNSTALVEISKGIGFKLVKCKIRRLPANRRYLPPPSKNAGIISKRMRTETVVTFSK